MNIIKALATVSGFTMVSRVLGLARDVITAAVFGAGPVMDAFLAAFRLPNMLRRFTAEGALTQAVVPIYKEAQNESSYAASTFAGDLIWSLIFFLTALTVVVFITAPQVIAGVAPGLEKPALAAALLQIVFPYIIFMSVMAMLTAMLNANGRFAAPAAAPILLNIALITAALWAVDWFAEPIFALAWGVFAGGLAQLLLVGIAVWRAGLQPTGRLHFLPTLRVRRATKLMLLGAWGAGATQINLLINLFIASWLPAGSISWLYYADRLMELPAGLLGAALATVILPALSAYAHDSQKTNILIDSTLRLTLTLAMPAAVGMALLAAPIVNVLFLHGQFVSDDAAMTTQAVLAYSIGVVGLVATRPLVAAFFARQDAVTPAKTALFMLATTQIMNVMLVFGMGWNHVGLALSLSLASCLNAVMLWAILRYRRWHLPASGWGRFIFVVVVSITIMAALIWLTLPDDNFWENSTLLTKIFALLGIIIAAATFYFIALRIGGIRLSTFYHSLPSSPSPPVSQS